MNLPAAGEAAAGEVYAGTPPGESAGETTFAYYRGLVTSEYQTAAKMLAWLTASITPFQDGLICLMTFAPAFDINQAVGPQLDVLGNIIGQRRTVDFQPSNGVSPILDDDGYRFLLKARIMQNHWDGRIGTLLAMWRRIFPGGTLLVTDHQDMTVTLVISGAFTSIMQDLISHGYIVPRPQGVLYNYSFPTLPILGLDRSDDYVAGLDLGHFV